MKKKIYLIVIAVVLGVYFISPLSPIVVINKSVHFVFEETLDLFYYDVDGEPYDNDDIEDIKRLKMMKNFKIQGNNITDFSFFKELNGLENILLWGNYEYIDLSSIKYCKNLKKFYGGAFCLENLDIFKECTNISTLSVEVVDDRLLLNEKSILYDISAVKNLSNLEYFSVAGNNIEDISALKECKKLKNVKIKGIADGTDSSVFLELPELKYLEVDKGVLSDDLKEKLIAKGVEVKEYDY